MPNACMAARSASRSTWIPPTIRPTEPNSWLCSTAITTPGAICPWWDLSPSITSRSSTCSRRSCDPARPRRRRERWGFCGELCRCLRQRFRKARIRVRLDAGFANPQLLEFLDAQPDVEYVVAMAKNAVLKRQAKWAMRQARKLSRQSRKTEHVYGETRYAAQTWPHRRRMIIKAEVVREDGKEPKDNPRFVITNLTQSPQWIYEQVYCQRGEIENRIKELHYGLQIGRTSCSSFWANQFRVLLTAAAYVLMQELRLRAARTDCARAQVGTLRERLLKLGARVIVSVRRVVLHLPTTFPFFRTFRRVALALGASPG